jgi:hypothetical protein
MDDNTSIPVHSAEICGEMDSQRRGDAEISVAAMSTVASVLNLEKVEAALRKASVSSAYT